MKTPYDILKRPLITEKTAYQSSKLHQYVFEVDSSATKVDVKDAIEKAFDVNVLEVNIINVPAKRGKRARSRRVAIRNSAYKKAIVTLAAEDRIAIFEGVEE
ncbi:MAG: 50S ribosomal protein L23 [Anaerolineaceae bacterium]|jgi:large subunit ribosomal protein L23|nr:MAG: 50S ribosomal protein L23 [Anaerolineaceae bacterium]